MKRMVIRIIVGVLGMVSKGSEMRLGALKFRNRIKTLQTTVKINKNTQMSPEDQKRLAVPKTPLKDPTYSWCEISNRQK